MIISGKLAHKLQNRLQYVMSCIDIERYDLAKATIREISFLINSRVISDLMKTEWIATVARLRPDLTIEEIERLWREFEEVTGTDAL